MLVKLLFIIILGLISIFCWVSLTNPLDVQFRFFGKIIPTDLSTLMITSLVLGALLVFISTLARDAKRAIEGYRQSRKRKKEQSIKEELNKGMEDFLRGDLARAKAHFTEVLKNDPFQKDLYLKLSEISVKEGNDEEALHWLERARWIDNKNVEIPLRQAEIYQRAKRLDEAIRTLKRAIGLDESNLKALKSLREIYRNSRRWEEAIRVQKSILKLAKGKQTEEEENLFYLGLKYEYARDLLSQGEEDLEDALKAAKEIVREEKTFEPGFVLLGDIYLRIGKWASAGKVWGKELQAVQIDHLHPPIGRALSQQGGPGHPAPHLSKDHERQSGQLDARLLLCQALFKAGDAGRSPGGDQYDRFKTEGLPRPSQAFGGDLPPQERLQPGRPGV